MKKHYLLWTTGEDRPGIVAAVSKVLYEAGCNLEDSAMTRLGSEFGILLIFSAPREITSGLTRRFDAVRTRFALNIGIKAITPHQARSKKTARPLALVTVHAPDRRGIVYHVTSALARLRFNVTDLNTHRTSATNNPGFILFAEGEFPSAKVRKSADRTLKAMGQRLGCRITLQDVPVVAL